jgi:hypothetical protein
VTTANGANKESAWERGDFSRTDWADPEIEIEMVGGPEPGVWRGMAGAAEFTWGFLSAWNEVRLVADKHREVDDERVVALVHYSGRGGTSGVDLGRWGRSTRTSSRSATAT